MKRRMMMLTLGAAALTPTIVSAVDGPWSDFGQGTAPDIGDYATILQNGVRMGSDGVARFDYSGAEARALRDTVATLARVDPTGLTRDAAFAHWANLYNALTLSVVVDVMPVASIRDIGGSLFSPGPWKDKRVEVLGTPLSLDDIEHGILRPTFGDPRVHYAVNCASLGCPNLRAQPWRAASLEADLNAAARAYVNHPRGAQMTDRGLATSSIYKWFREDFGYSAAGVVAHLRQYAEDDLATALSDIRSIADDRYDWSLNDI